MTILLLLRLTGASLIVLSLFHVVLWRTLNWDDETTRLSPLNARVFSVHAFFIAFVLFALGLLSLIKPHLLVLPSELARLVLMAVVAFWIARLVIQVLVFDRVMQVGWTRSPALRIGACLAWLMYAAVYGTALLGQFRAD